MSLARPWHTYVGLEPSTVDCSGPDTVVWLDIGALLLTDNTLYSQVGTKCVLYSQYYAAHDGSDTRLL